MLVGSRNVVNIPPGVNKDDNSFTSAIYTDAQQMRFFQNLPEMIGGWREAVFSNTQVLTGVPRTVYSYLDFAGKKHILIGTNTRLYTFEGGSLYNITPLMPVGMTPLGTNPITTYFEALVNDPIAVTVDSNIVTIKYTSATIPTNKLQPLDKIKISGVPAGNIGGIPDTAINGIRSITAVTATTITFLAAVTATSTVTAGGGAGVELGTAVIKVTDVAHGFANGDRIGITGATTTGGITDTQINVENIIRNVDPMFPNVFDVYLINTNTWSTSGVAGGGVAVYIQGQIPAGKCSQNAGSGYGGGSYGTGLYSTNRPFTNPAFLPRIWSIDRYADGVVMTPGDAGANTPNVGGGIYEWYGNLAVAPTLLSAAMGATNVPTAVNYVFVSQNQVIAFGKDGIGNQINTSVAGDIYNWDITAASTTAFEQQLEGVGRLLSHGSSKEQQLLFSGSAVYAMRYVDLPDIWDIKEITTADGILAPNASIEVQDSVIWCGKKDFYIYNGSVLKSISNNTLKHWFFDNLNTSKCAISFARNYSNFNEFWLFAPFYGDIGNGECGTYVIWNYDEGHWTNGNLIRTACEDSQDNTFTQWLTSGSCDGSIPTKIYQHEIAFSAAQQVDGVITPTNLIGSLTTNFTQIAVGDTLQQITRIVPSNVLLPLGIINSNQDLYNITCNTKEYDGSPTIRTFGPYDVTAQTAKIETRISGRQRQYIYNFNSQVGFRIQQTYEEIKASTVR